MDHANYRPSSVILRGFPDHAELDLDAILGGSAVFLVNENENENYKKNLKNKLDCAQRAQTSAKASNLNQKWSGIRTTFKD